MIYRISVCREICKNDKEKSWWDFLTIEYKSKCPWTLEFFSLIHQKLWSWRLNILKHHKNCKTGQIIHNFYSNIVVFFKRYLEEPEFENKGQNSKILYLISYKLPCEHSVRHRINIKLLIHSTKQLKLSV